MSDALPVIEQQVASGEGWTLARGRDPATGEPRLVLSSASADLDEVRRWLAVAGSTEDRHLAPALDAVDLGDGSVGVVLAVPSGPSLQDVLARRGPLSAGEVVTLVTPLVGTVARLHGRDLSLAVDAALVWLSREGRPMLLPLPGGASPDGGQVKALAAIALGVLDSASVGAAAVGEVLDAAASGRSDARRLAEEIARATPALALAKDGAVDVPVRRRSPRLVRAWPAIAVVVVAVVAAAVGGLWGSRDHGGAVLAAPPHGDLNPASPATPARSWLSVMSHLEHTRARAYATGDVTLLDEVYAAGSTVGAADKQMLSRMTGRAERAAGLRAYVQHADVVASDDSHATLRVTDALTAYDVVGTDGRVLRHGLGRPAREWRVTLVRAAAGWRIWTIFRR